jgi:SAM-dependent methyltransferase
MPYKPEDFTSLFARSDDPWQFRSRWYEARKRALTLACLPSQRYCSGYEPGCANGELSAALADRCEHLTISDGVAAAVKLARARVAGLSHVRVVQAWLPQQWPDETFDLVVISELGYFLTGDQLDLLATKLLSSLRSGGTVLACHWRWPIEGGELDGDAVHRTLQRRLAMPRLCTVLEPDLRLDVWCQDGRSVAAREGLT